MLLLLLMQQADVTMFLPRGAPACKLRSPGPWLLTWTVVGGLHTAYGVGSAHIPCTPCTYSRLLSLLLLL